MLIPLSKAGARCGQYATVVDEEDSDLSAMNWYAKVVRDGLNTLVYAMSQQAGKPIRMHRLIWQRVHGSIPVGYEVDHVRHGEYGGLDNRRDNLRLATHARNIANGRIRSSNTSGFKGVHLVKRIGRWQALIRVDGRRFHLGYFDTAEDAGAAYIAAAVERFGEFALER